MNTIPQRASHTQEYDLEEDNAYYVTRQPTSAVRYQQPRQQVIQRGNKRIVIHNEPPCRQPHWSLILGIGDSTGHPTHFVAINLNARITIIEIQGGDSSHARIYSGPTLFSDNGDSIPVTLEFKDVNSDGKVDMIVHIGDQKIVYLNDGTQFKPQP